jgi:hypothetical protein
MLRSDPLAVGWAFLIGRLVPKVEDDLSERVRLPVGDLAQFNRIQLGQRRLLDSAVEFAGRQDPEPGFRRWCSALVHESGW